MNGAGSDDVALRAERPRSISSSLLLSRTQLRLATRQTHGKWLYLTDHKWRKLFQQLICTSPMLIGSARNTTQNWEGAMLGNIHDQRVVWIYSRFQQMLTNVIFRHLHWMMDMLELSV